MTNLFGRQVREDNGIIFANSLWDLKTSLFQNIEEV